MRLHSRTPLLPLLSFPVSGFFESLASEGVPYRSRLFDPAGRTQEGG